MDRDHTWTDIARCSNICMELLFNLVKFLGFWSSSLGAFQGRFDLVCNPHWTAFHYAWNF